MMESGSDEPKHILCDPCNYDNKIAAADTFCHDCNENLCPQCKHFHTKFQATRKHKLTTGYIPSPKQSKDLLLKLCDKHRSNEVKFYCYSHNCVLCSICKVSIHSGCKSKPIAEVMEQGTDRQELHMTKDSIKDLIDSFQNSVNTSSQLYSEIEQTANDYKVKLFQLKDKLDWILDQAAIGITMKEAQIKENLAEDSQTETNSVYNEAVSNLETLLADIQTTLHSNDPVAIFSARLKSSKLREDYSFVETKLKSRFESPTVEFRQYGQVIEALENCLMMCELHIKPPTDNKQTSQNNTQNVQRHPERHKQVNEELHMDQVDACFATIKATKTESRSQASIPDKPGSIETELNPSVEPHSVAEPKHVSGWPSIATRNISRSIPNLSDAGISFIYEELLVEPEAVGHGPSGITIGLPSIGPIERNISSSMQNLANTKMGFKQDDLQEDKIRLNKEQLMKNSTNTEVQLNQSKSQKKNQRRKLFKAMTPKPGKQDEQHTEPIKVLPIYSNIVKVDKQNTTAKNIVSKAPFGSLKLMQGDFKIIRVPNDKETCDITGSAFLPDGWLVLCDHQNMKIKLLNQTFEVIDSLRVDTKPWDVAVLTEDEIAVTLPKTRMVQFFKITDDKLVKHRKFQVKQDVWGIDSFEETIVITVHKFDHSEGALEIRKHNGACIRQIITDPHDTPFFKAPGYVTINKQDAKIYVSDGKRNAIMCFTFEGTLLRTFENPSLRWPRKIVRDCGNNLIICARYADSLKLLPNKPSGSDPFRTFLDTCIGPQTISYRGTDMVFIVGRNKADELLILTYTLK